MRQLQSDPDHAALDAMILRARAAMSEVAGYDQARIDRLCQALGWATANEKTFNRIVAMSIEESRLGDPEGRKSKRMKILGVLRDALRQKSTGIIEQIPERGIVKYAKPAGVIASLVPTTNPELTPPYTGIYALKCLDAVIFSPHPRSKRTTFEMVRVMREAIQPPGRAGGSVPVHRESERAAHAIPHGQLRSHARHRRTADGARRLQLRASRLWRRRRQFDDGDRRDRRHRHRGAQYAHVEDLGLRVRMFGRRQHPHRLDVSTTRSSPRSSAKVASWPTGNRPR